MEGQTIGSALSGYIRKHVLLAISAVLVIVTLLMFRPSFEDVGSFIDVRVLCILFCFMVSVAGITTTGAFDRISNRLVSRCGDARRLVLVLVFLPFFASMAITNDVSLITFVPLAILVLRAAGRNDLIIPVLALQTVAANLGSILTPFGNPQNLFVFSSYGLGLGEFVLSMTPLVVVGTVLLLLSVYIVSKGEVMQVREETTEGGNRTVLSVMMALFILSVICVLGWVPYQLVMIISVIAALIVCRRSLLKVDYSLLLTFVFLFIFTGTLTTIPEINDVLTGLMSNEPYLFTAGLSQIVSNVPATIMLQPFTMDWQGLIAGANIAGFGTPIASMASIITFGIYSGLEDARQGRYLLVFMMYNIVQLVVLLPLGIFLYN